MFQTYTRRRRRTSTVPVPMVKQYRVPPDDVIEDIFARLPAKAVYRCCCLSRTWAARLISDDFTDLHLRLANRHSVPKILLLQDSVSRCAKVQVWSPDNPGGTALMEVPVRIATRSISLPTLSHNSVEVSSSSNPQPIIMRCISGTSNVLILLLLPTTVSTQIVNKRRRVQSHALHYLNTHELALYLVHDTLNKISIYLVLLFTSNRRKQEYIKHTPIYLVLLLTSKPHRASIYL
jgi:hypothetical protein